MFLDILLCSVLLNVASSAHNNGAPINRLLEIIKRRDSGIDQIIGAPRDPEDLPEAEPILPGHTLLRPSVGMLKSAVKFPHKDPGRAVYGNIKNVGITYGKTGHRVLYTGFRRGNNRMKHVLQQAIKNIVMNNGNKSTDTVVLIKSSPADNSVFTLFSEKQTSSEALAEENDASEILDMYSSEESENLRRSVHKEYKRRHKYRDRGRSGHYTVGSSSSSSSLASSSSSSSDYETNEGNPFTLHKGKYKQNWMWNHFLDGDHMNVNPYAPNFGVKGHDGPTGGDLFFGRKWWYFHEKDFKPLR